MVKYSCPRCGKDFAQRSHYSSHQNRKRQCENTMEKVNEIVEERIQALARPVETSNLDTSHSDAPVSILEILKNALNDHSYGEIAVALNVATGTVKRWIELESVPTAYQFDLMKFSKIPIDYSKFSYKEKDQFYTPVETARTCFDRFKTILESNGESDAEYTYIEPSAGDGSFLTVLPTNRTIAFDIDPKAEGIETVDYLEWNPPTKEKYIVFGNPPFGLRGQLALKFINHSAQFADYVCFILPQLFESDGKGVPRKRVTGYNLIHSEKLDTEFYEPSKKSVKVNCIFQVWSKHHISKAYELKAPNSSVLKIYSLSDGGTPSTTRNKKMFYDCDMYIPSTCFGKNSMTHYNTFDELPRKKGYGIVFHENKKKNIQKFKDIDWSSVAFLSTNSAYNIRSSQIIEQFT